MIPDEFCGRLPFFVLSLVLCTFGDWSTAGIIFHVCGCMSGPFRFIYIYNIYIYTLSREIGHVRAHAKREIYIFHGFFCGGLCTSCENLLSHREIVYIAGNEKKRCRKKPLAIYLISFCQYIFRARKHCCFFGNTPIINTNNFFVKIFRKLGKCWPSVWKIVKFSFQPYFYKNI